MTEERSSDEVVWNCSLSQHKDVSHQVRLLFNGTQLEDQQIQKSMSHSWASLKSQTHGAVYEKRFRFLECEVKYSSPVQKFPFWIQLSGENNQHKHSVNGFVDYGIKLSALSRFCLGEDTNTAEDVTSTPASPSINGSDATLFLFICD